MIKTEQGDSTTCCNIFLGASLRPRIIKFPGKATLRGLAAYRANTPEYRRLLPSGSRAVTMLWCSRQSGRVQSDLNYQNWCSETVSDWFLFELTRDCSNTTDARGELSMATRIFLKPISSFLRESLFIIFSHLSTWECLYAIERI